MRIIGFLKNNIVAGITSAIGSGWQKARELLGIKFVKDTLFLQAGGFITRMVAIPFGIILARLLHPEGLGLYYLAFAVLGLIGIIGNLGVGDAGINRLAKAYAARDAEEIKDILSFVLKMMLLMTVIVFTVGMIIAPYIAEAMYQNNEIGLFVRVLLLTMPLAILFGLSGIIFQSTRNMKTLVVSESLKELIAPPIVATGVLLGFGVMGAVSGNVIATAIGALIASILYFRLRSSNPILPSFREMLLKRLKLAKFKEYFRFSFLIAIDKNIPRMYDILPVLFIGMFSLTEEAGFFRIALGIATIPTFFAGAVSRNTAAKLPEVYSTNPAELKAVFYKITRYTTVLVLLAGAVVLVVGPFVIELFYGVEYLPAITTFYLLAVVNATRGVGVGIGPILRTLNRVDISIKWNIVGLAAMALVGVLTIPTYGAFGAALAMAAWRLLGAGGVLFSTWRLLIRFHQTARGNQSGK